MPRANIPIIARAPRTLNASSIFGNFNGLLSRPLTASYGGEPPFTKDMVGDGTIVKKPTATTGKAHFFTDSESFDTARLAFQPGVTVLVIKMIMRLFGT